MRYLSKDQVLQVHTALSMRFGFSDELRDESALDQALHLPESTFDGCLVHPDVSSVAAAYMWYFVQNHPFVEGNVVLALMAGYIFSESNGVSWKMDNVILKQVMGALEESLLTKQELIAFMSEGLS